MSTKLSSLGLALGIIATSMQQGRPQGVAFAFAADKLATSEV